MQFYLREKSKKRKGQTKSGKGLNAARWPRVATTTLGIHKLSICDDMHRLGLLQIFVLNMKNTKSTAHTFKYKRIWIYRAQPVSESSFESKQSCIFDPIQINSSHLFCVQNTIEANCVV